MLRMPVVTVMAVVVLALIVRAAPSAHAAGPAAASPRIEIVELPRPSAPGELPAIRWVQPQDASWQQGAPSFTIAPEQGTSAQGWLAVTTENILMKVVVVDDMHVNTRAGGDIWDGDCLQIGVDALGDGVGDLPSETRMVGPDDASITVALTERGTEVWAHFQGHFGQGYIADGARNSYPCSVERDNQAGTTTYRVGFPWADFGTSAGMSPVLGLCVQVNDTDQGPEQLRIYWGRGADGEPRPGLFERLLISPPPGEVVSAEVSRTDLWRASDGGEIRFAIAREGAVEVTARMSGLEKTRSLGRFSLSNGIRRFAVRGYPGKLSPEPVALSAELRDERDRRLARQEAQLGAPGLVIGRLTDRIEELVAGSPDPLFTRHLRSVEALVQGEWSRVMMAVDEQPAPAVQAARDAEDILAGLNGDAGQWETYRQGDRALVLARVMSDSSLQHYLLTLPRNWSADRTYPLIVDLHGAGPSRKLAYVQMDLAPRTEEAGTPDSSVPRDHFRLAPWGRGNQGYDEWAEDDVSEALTDVQRRFKVDPDRTYLTGHSMGGGGTWSIGIRTPDIWAAICPAAGGTWGTPVGLGLGRNASYLPVRIWHGDADGSVSVENAYTMQAELRRYGNEPEMVIVPGQGHDYPGDAQLETTRWLLSHVRQRPDRFEYICDSPRHRGVWGIQMNLDPAVDPMPRFECRIEGNTVRVSSYGTAGLDVQLGEGGLGLEGDVVVYWNGQKAYEGPANQITLGSGG